MKEVTQVASQFDQDSDIGAIVLTGSEKAFAGSSVYNPSFIFF